MTTAQARRLARAAVALGALGVGAAATGAEETRWQVVGHQGLVQIVIMPTEEARNQGLYETAVLALCEPERTCFVNFFTNSAGVKAALPLPEAIASEATATYRRSAKNGVTIFMWSCRLKIPDRECF